MTGVTLFVTAPAVLEGRGAASAALWGGLFGLVAYGTYDLTNLATLAGFPWTIALLDMAWGVTITAAMAGAARAAVR